VQSLQRKWTETAKNWNFSKSNWHNSVKNCSIVPKTELDLDTCILMKNLYTKVHFSLCNQCKKISRNCWWTDRQQLSNMPSLLYYLKQITKEISLILMLFYTMWYTMSLFLVIRLSKQSVNLLTQSTIVASHGWNIRSTPVKEEQRVCYSCGLWRCQWTLKIHFKSIFQPIVIHRMV
jgi:hypothetical protein